MRSLEVAPFGAVEQPVNLELYEAGDLQLLRNLTGGEWQLLITTTLCLSPDSSTDTVHALLSSILEYPEHSIKQHTERPSVAIQPLLARGTIAYHLQTLEDRGLFQHIVPDATRTSTLGRRLPEQYQYSVAADMNTTIALMGHITHLTETANRSVTDIFSTPRGGRGLVDRCNISQVIASLFPEDQNTFTLSLAELSALTGIEERTLLDDHIPSIVDNGFARYISRNRSNVVYAIQPDATPSYSPGSVSDEILQILRAEGGYLSIEEIRNRYMALHPDLEEDPAKDSRLLSIASFLARMTKAGELSRKGSELVVTRQQLAIHQAIADTAALATSPENYQDHTQTGQDFWRDFTTIPTHSSAFMMRGLVSSWQIADEKTTGFAETVATRFRETTQRALAKAQEVLVNGGALVRIQNADGTHTVRLLQNGSEFDTFFTDPLSLAMLKTYLKSSTTPLFLVRNRSQKSGRLAEIFLIKPGLLPTRLDTNAPVDQILSNQRDHTIFWQALREHLQRTIDPKGSTGRNYLQEVIRQVAPNHQGNFWTL